MSPWLVGLIGFFLYRRGRRRAERKADAGRRGGHRRGAARDVRLPDGRVTVQVTTGLFAPDPEGDDQGEVWRRVMLEGTGTAESQEAFLRTLAAVASGGRQADGVPVLLAPLGTRRRVNAVDVHAAGGRLGHLPEHAVRSVGASIRATEQTDGRPCAVQARIMPAPSGQLVAEVLLPEVFTPGGPSTGR